MARIDGAVFLSKRGLQFRKPRFKASANLFELSRRVRMRFGAACFQDRAMLSQLSDLGIRSLEIGVFGLEQSPVFGQAAFELAYLVVQLSFKLARGLLALLDLAAFFPQ
jgi:hypothetical protein